MISQLSTLCIQQYDARLDDGITDMYCANIIAKNLLTGGLREKYSSSWNGNLNPKVNNSWIENDQ